MRIVNNKARKGCLACKKIQRLNDNKGLEEHDVHVAKLLDAFRSRANYDELSTKEKIRFAADMDQYIIEGCTYCKKISIWTHRKENGTKQNGHEKHCHIKYDRKSLDMFGLSVHVKEFHQTRPIVMFCPLCRIRDDRWKAERLAAKAAARPAPNLLPRPKLLPIGREMRLQDGETKD